MNNKNKNSKEYKRRIAIGKKKIAAMKQSKINAKRQADGMVVLFLEGDTIKYTSTHAITGVQIDHICTLGISTSASGLTWTNGTSIIAFDLNAASSIPATDAPLDLITFTTSPDQSCFTTLVFAGPAGLAIPAIWSLPSCDLDVVTLNLYDSYGDGWNGNSLTINDGNGNDGNDGNGNYSIPDLNNDFTTTDILETYVGGSELSIDLCLDLTKCTRVTYNATGLFQSENSWTITNGVNVIASGANNNSSVGNGSVGNYCEGDVLGCIDQLACNYDSNATVEDNTCEYAVGGYDCGGICENTAATSVIYTAGIYPVEDSFTITDCNNNVLASMADGTNGYSGCIVLPDQYTVNLVDSYGDGWNESKLDIGGTTYTIDTGYTATFQIGDPCEGDVLGCTDSTACNYDSNATVEDNTCEYAVGGYDCGGICENTAATSVIYTAGIYPVEDSFTITDCNNNVLASMADGTNGYSGCIVLPDQYTVNLVDSYGDGWNESKLDIGGTTYTIDAINDDGITATFQIGDPCDVSGCTDPTACNYDPDATNDDSTCTYADEGCSCAGVCGDPHVLTFGGNRCELPHVVEKYNFLTTENLVINADTVMRGEEAFVNNIYINYNESSFTINLNTLDLVDEANFNFQVNQLGPLTKEFITEDSKFRFMVNSEKNGFLIKSIENLTQENSSGVLMSDDFDECIIKKLY